MFYETEYEFKKVSYFSCFGFFFFFSVETDFKNVFMSHYFIFFFTGKGVVGKTIKTEKEF